MKMHELCEKTGISKRNIHYYINEGLIDPKQNPENGYYDFSEEDLRRLHMIRSLREADFSLGHIRAILQQPSTAVYYMNLQLKDVRSKIAHLEKLERSLSYMQHNLPMHPTFKDLEKLVENAGIPAPRQEFLSGDSFEENDNELVNRYLWETFFPDEPLTEYQEYLWSKINRFTEGRYEADYRNISKALHSFSEKQIKQYFSDNRQIHKEVILLQEKDYDAYADKIKEAIQIFLDDKRLISFWKSQYITLLAPSARLYDSEMAKTMEELSPLFSAYRINAKAVCRIVYEYLQSNEGKPLLDQIKKSLGDLVDIEGCSHGQLQAMACVHMYALN